MKQKKKSSKKQEEIKTKKQKNKQEKLRILAVGDIHGDTGLSKKLAEQAKKEDVDLVILTGDITFAERPVENLLKPFEKVHKKVLLIPGNHETVATANFFAEVYPNVKNIHGYSIRAGDVGIFGAGSANIGIFKLNDKDMFYLLQRGWKKIKDKKKKIMVTHVHPTGTLMEKLTDYFPGSEAVEKAIKKFKPDIALCSHVHEAAGVEEKIGKTKLINVSRKGKIIEI